MKKGFSQWIHVWLIVDNQGRVFAACCIVNIFTIKESVKAVTKAASIVYDFLCVRETPVLQIAYLNCNLIKRFAMKGLQINNLAQECSIITFCKFENCYD